MGKYTLIQLKRLGRALVWAVPAMALLTVCLVLGAMAMLAGQSQEDSRTQFPIGIVGIPDSGMLRLGLSAIESLDDLGFAVDMQEFSEEEAEAALESGQINAYAVIPPGFVSAANRGEILTIRYITKANAGGMNTLFQQEVTGIISRLLLQSQKASFGAYAALEPYIGHEEANRVLNEFSEELAQYIFLRNRTGQVELLGVGDAPGFAEYMACGLAVTLALMAALSFAPMSVLQNAGVNILLRSRGRSDIGQSLIDYLVLFAGEVVCLAVLLLGVSLAIPQIKLSMLLPMLPIAAMVAALAFLCYSWMRQLLGGVLLYFFTALAMALVCGCMYPVWFFPESIQRLAAVLPGGMARQYLTDFASGRSGSALWGLLGYSAAFLALALVGRVRRIRAGEVGA